MKTATLSGQTPDESGGGVRRFVTLLVAGSLAASGLVALEAVTPSSAQAAVVCDRSAPADGADALALLRAAIDECDAVRLGEGDYKLSNTLVITKNVTLQGVGSPGNVDPNTPGGSRIMLGAGVRNAGVLSIGGASPVTVSIDGLTIMGGQTRGNGGGISVASNATLDLKNSTVRQNTATEGAGVENNGTLVVNSSTFLNNEASKKGGGIRSQGTATIVNSTFQGNSASQGGAISTPGSGKVVHSTITRNFSTSSSSAGIDRNGGSLQVFYSIIGDNTRTNGSPAADCSGTPDLIGLNLVTDSSGCNPVGPIEVAARGGLGLDPLAGNGGPTLTRAVQAVSATLPISPALDRIATEAAPASGCVSTAVLAEYGLGDLGAGVIDQRGTPRPAGNGCDLGSFELTDFAVEYSLDVDTTNYENLPAKYPAGVVEVGVRSVAVEDLATALSAPAPASSSTVESSGVRNIGVRNIGVRNIGVRNIGVRNIGVRNIGVRNIGVRNIGVRNIGVRNIALKDLGVDTFINTIPLSEIPLLGSRTAPLGEPDSRVLVPEGWAAYLAGTQYDGLPLQSLTLETLIAAAPATTPPDPMPTPPLDEITLEDLDLSNSVLGAIALRSAALAGVPLLEIPPPTGTTWCELFSELCTKLGGQDELLKLDLLSVQLAGGDVDAADVGSIDLGATLKSIGVRNIGVRNIGVRNIGVRNINIQNSGVRNIGVRNIGVRNIGVRNIELILNCSSERQPCDPDSELTLGQVFDEDLWAEGATVGDLIDAIVDGLELNPDLLNGLTLADFLALFVPNEQVPWEQIDFGAAALQNIGNPAQPTFDYLAKVKVVGTAATSLAVTLNLPEGFLLAARSGETPLLSGGAIGTPIPLTPVKAETNGGMEFEFPPNALAPGDYVLRIPVRAGIVTGEGIEATSNLAVQGPTAIPLLQDKASVTVVPVADRDGDGGPAGGTASPLTFGDLTLAHIASAGDVDIFSFTPATSGASARVLLSNIPEGVDYDLSIYAPIAQPLRGTSADPASTRKSLGDIRYDLDPSDDIFPTDLTDDIDLDVLGKLGTGYELRDISSRRSNTDEEVALPVVEAGITYLVAVTSYLGAFSNQPYGIRVRLDVVNDPPPCRTSDRILKPLEIDEDDLFDPPSTKTNTLYLTNLEWLATDFPSQYGDIIDAALATDDFDGSPVTDPAIIDVSRDNNVKDAYAVWAAEPCDVEARNGVVRAIGKVLDGINAPVENIVILGGDGIVPMAAIRDLTGYSNEATAAQNVLTNGLNNPVSAAQGAGFLLSDDPYATPAGISIRNAGQQLYVPDVSIGRLVETGADILGQLKNFTEYKGQLDPGTRTVTGAVTAYDFLTDGGEAVANNLRAGLGDVSTSQGGVDLLGDTWNRDDYLALFAGGGPDVVSPNAHYDWEALLPAAPDGEIYYTDAELVFTSDVVDLGIEQSLLFTMGCHAGLSVSDVQLGFTVDNPALDWAETYAGGGNQWIAHTTYGYGDDEIVAYSERLAAIFALQLSAHILGGDDAPQTLGEAMVRAKQEFLATTFTLTPYDEKIMQSWTYYGLPMYEIGGGTGESSDSSQFIESSTTGTTPATFEDSDTLLPAVGGGTVTPVSVLLDRTVGRSGPSNLNRVTTPNGTYYEVGGNTATAQHRPVQPLVSLAVPSNVPAAGFLITELTSIDERPEAPLYLKPTIDLSGNERRVEPADGSFPANLQLVTTDNAGSQRLLLAAGQFQSGAGTDPDTQRIFTGVEGQLYHSNSNNPSDGIGPLIKRVETADPIAGRPTNVAVTAEASAKRVVVLYQTGFNGKWASKDLTKVGGKWEGELPASNSTRVVEFLIQAVDDQGDVGISDNKVQNFFDSPVPSGDELTITATPAPNETGYNNESVTVTITGESADDFDFVSLNGIEVEKPTSNVLTVKIIADGVNVVFVRDSSGVGQFFTVVLDSTDPTISSDPTGATLWGPGPATVDFTATDELSGVASITTKVGTAGELVTQGATASVSVDIEGITKVTAFATDVAGNRSAPVEVDVRIDGTAPVVNSTVSPTTGWAPSSKITLESPSTVNESPTRIECQVGPTDEVRGTVWTPYDTPVTIDKERWSLWARAIDDAGNTGPEIQIEPQVDVTKPSATITGMPTQTLQLGDVVDVVGTCEDSLSGMASCVLSGNVSTLVSDTLSTTGRLDTTTTGTKSVTLRATDNAGNWTEETMSYTVGQRVCELYDSTSVANAGSNYTIKLQICDSQGQPTADNGKLTLTAIAAYKVADDGTLSDPITIEPSSSGRSNSGFEFRFSAKDKQYVYNLATQRDWVTSYGPGTYVLGFVVGSFTKPRESTPPTNFARFEIA